MAAEVTRSYQASWGAWYYQVQFPDGGRQEFKFRDKKPTAAALTAFIAEHAPVAIAEPIEDTSCPIGRAVVCPVVKPVKPIGAELVLGGPGQ